MQRQSTFVLAQMASDTSPEVNLEKAAAAVAKANELYHPDVVVFPELYMSFFPAGTARTISLRTAQSLDGPFVTGMRGLAKKYGIWLIFGMNETVEDPQDDRNYNTVVFVNAEGELVSVYRKTHLYDALGIKESDNNKPGDHLFEPIDTPFGRIGLFVCYEVRFPEIARYQRFKGADIIIMPAAWAAGKLKSLHLRALITARAIENIVYLLVCDQCGADSIGESAAIDPMGVPLAAGGESESLLAVRVDLDRIDEVRTKLPSCQNRRPELYAI